MAVTANPNIVYREEKGPLGNEAYNLTPQEVDGNFLHLDERVTTLEENPGGTAPEFSGPSQYYGTNAANQPGAWNLPAGLSGQPDVYNAEDYGIVPGANVSNAVAVANTAALNSLINAVIHPLGRNATIKFPSQDVYSFDGDYYNPERINSLIYFPSVPITAAYYSITIEGNGPPAFSPSGFTIQPIARGTVLRCLKTTGGGTNPSFFGGKGPAGGDNFECSYMVPGFKDIQIQAVNNPPYTALNFDSFTGRYLRNVGVCTMAGYSAIATENPTYADSYGVIDPHYSSGIYMRTEEALVICGFYNGIRQGENAVADEILVFCCRNAAIHDYSHGLSKFGRFSSVWCVNGLVFNAAHKVLYEVFNTERWDTSAPGVDSRWFDFAYDLVDGSNVGSGDIQFISGKAMVGNLAGTYNKATNRHTNFAQSGGDNFKIEEIGKKYDYSGWNGDTPPDTAVLAQDTFTAADGTNLASRSLDTGGTWYRIEGTAGHDTIINNRGVAHLDNASGYAYMTPTLNTNRTVRMTFNFEGVNAQGYIICRTTDADNTLMVGLGGGMFRIMKVVGGVYTTLATQNTDLPV